MNIKMKIVLFIGVILFLAAGLYPVFGKYSISRSGGYGYGGPQRVFSEPVWRSTGQRAFLLNRPEGLVVDYKQLFMEWALIAVPTISLLFILKNNRDKNDKLSSAERM